MSNRNIPRAALKDGLFYAVCAGSRRTAVRVVFTAFFRYNKSGSVKADIFLATGRVRIEKNDENHPVRSLRAGAGSGCTGGGPGFPA